MNKKNRYTIVLEGHLENRHLFSRKMRVEDLYKEIYEYNKNNNNPYFIGDLTFNGKTRTLYYRRYTKLSKPSNLELLDEMTTKLENEESLKKYLNINNRNKLFITYKVNKVIKNINIFYKKDIKYLNEYYLESKFIENSKNKKFLRRLLNDSFLSSFPLSKDEFDGLVGYVGLGYFASTKYIEDFFRAFCYPNNKRSYINIRYLANFMREFDKSFNIVTEEIINYPNQIEGQVMIDNYNVGSLSNFYEDIKMNEICEEEVIKKLIR